MLELKTDMKSHERLWADVLDMKIGFDSDLELKWTQIMSIDDKIAS